jgi:hypothetical protein
MHYPPMNIDLSEHLRQLSVTASTTHERRERVRRQEARPRRRWWRRAEPAPRGCEPATEPATANC